MIVLHLDVLIDGSKRKRNHVLLATICDLLTQKQTFTKISFYITGSKWQSVKTPSMYIYTFWSLNISTHTLSGSWYHKEGRLTVVHDLRSNQQHSVCVSLSTSVQNNGRTSVNFRPFHENDRSYCNMVGLAVRPLIYWLRWAAVCMGLNVWSSKYIA